MPSKTQTLQIAADRYRELQRLAAGEWGRHGADLSIRLNEIARRLVAIVGAGSNGSGVAVDTTDQLDQIMRDMDRAILELRAGAESVYARGYSAMGLLVQEEIPAVYAGFGRTSARALKAARAEFVTAARDAAQYEAAFRKWADSFDDASFVLRNGMRDSLIRAQLEGWDQRALAESFLQQPAFQFENLPPISERARRVFSMSDSLSPSDALVRRAHVIARTEMNAVHNRMVRSWTKAAGFDLYKNMNGDPVAKECIEANAAGAMSWDEWARWRASNGRGGTPPRHPNCDSGLLAVPPDYASIEVDE